MSQKTLVFQLQVKVMLGVGNDSIRVVFYLSFRRTEGLEPPQRPVRPWHIFFLIEGKKKKNHGTPATKNIIK